MRSTATGAETRVRDAIQRVARSRRSGEVLWRVRAGDGSIDVTHGDPAQPFFVASATKLYVTALLAQLRTEGRLDWDAPLADHLPGMDLDGVVGPSGGVTVREVMGHVGGVADYFEGRPPQGPSTRQQLLTDDIGWDIDDVLAWTRQLEAPRRGRAHYSDTGYQLLGALVARLCGTSFAEAVRARIAHPLGLRHTYCFGQSELSQYDAITAIRLRDRELRRPLAMASLQSDGGIVSTLDDSMCFLDAFFDGRLFDRSLLGEIETGWQRIFYPLEYGTGIMRFRIPSPLRLGAPGALVGHSGATGSVLFRCHDTGVTVVGTVNQLGHRSLAYRLLARTARIAGSGGG